VFDRLVAAIWVAAMPGGSVCRVVAHEDGRPIPGATVRFMKHGDFQPLGTTARADDEGRFEFADDRLDVYAEVSAPGRATVSNWHKYTVFATEYSLPLARSIAGRLVLESGAPVAGARVNTFWIEEPAGLDTWLTCVAGQTDEEGRFELEDVAVGGWFVVTCCPPGGARGWSRTIQLAVDDSPPSSILVEIPWSMRIRGRLVAKESQHCEPWTVYVSGGSWLFPFKAETTCDIGGLFELDAVPEGDFEAEVVDHESKVYGDVEFAVRRGEPAPEVAIPLGPVRWAGEYSSSDDEADAAPPKGTGRVAGRVVGLRLDPKFGDGWPRTLVLRGAAERDVTTPGDSAEGAFEFAELPAGAYELWLLDRHREGTRRLTTFELADGARRSLGKLRVAPAPPIRGRFVRLDGGPVGQVRVHLVTHEEPDSERRSGDGRLSTPAATETDAGGWFEFTPHDGAVAVEALPGRESPAVSWLADFAPGAVVEILEPRGATLLGRVVDFRGAPMPGLAVIAIVRPLSDGWWTFGGHLAAFAHVDADGRFEMCGVPFGPCRIKVARCFGYSFDDHVAPSREIVVDQEVTTIPEFVVR